MCSLSVPIIFLRPWLAFGLRFSCPTERPLLTLGLCFLHNRSTPACLLDSRVCLLLDFVALDKMADEQIPSTSAAVPAVTRVDDDVEAMPYVKRHLYTGEVLQMWNLARLIRQLGTREQCVNFAVSEGLILASKECRRHRKPMSIEYSTNRTVGAFVCNKAGCRATSRVSRATGTWFEGAKLTLPQIFYITYCFAYSFSYDMVIHEDPTRDENNECLSRVTVCDWYNYCREVVVLYQIYHQEEKGKIGGPGKIVQIDESKFGKRKYNKG